MHMSFINRFCCCFKGTPSALLVTLDWTIGLISLEVEFDPVQLVLHLTKAIENLNAYQRLSLHNLYTIAVFWTCPTLATRERRLATISAQWHTLWRRAAQTWLQCYRSGWYSATLSLIICFHMHHQPMLDAEPSFFLGGHVQLKLQYYSCGTRTKTSNYDDSDAP